MQKQVQQRNENEEMSSAKTHKRRNWVSVNCINSKQDLKFVNGMVAEMSSQTEWWHGCKN